MRKIATSLALAATALAFAAAPAHADSVSFSGFAHGYESVNFALTDPAHPASGFVAAGGFSTSLNGSPSFTSYCVDLYQSIGFMQPAYTDYSQAGASHLFANPNAYADLGRLFASAGPIVDAVHEAAFQIAVWEIAYETAGSYDLANGGARFTGGSADTDGSLTLASTWLGQLGTISGGPTIGVLESPTHQDVIYAPVPEPETYLMMMAGLFGMTTFMHRRRSNPNRR